MKLKLLTRYDTPEPLEMVVVERRKVSLQYGEVSVSWPIAHMPPVEIRLRSSACASGHHVDSNVKTERRCKGTRGRGKGIATCECECHCVD